MNESRPLLQTVAVAFVHIIEYSFSSTGGHRQTGADTAGLG